MVGIGRGDFVWGRRSLGDVREAFAMAGEASASRGDVVWLRRRPEMPQRSSRMPGRRRQVLVQGTPQ